MFVIGEANFSDHGANRLGASALMQGLADGYFVLPATITEYLADAPFDKIDDSHPAAVEAMQGVQAAGADSCSTSTAPARPASFHRELGKLMWDLCGMERSEESLRKALDRIPRDPPGVLDQPQGHRRLALVQPDAGARRPGRRLHRARRADVHRRPAPQRELRRPLPRGEPDPRGRGAARRRELRLRRRLGVDAGRASRRSCTGKPSSTSTSTSPSGATSDDDPRGHAGRRVPPAEARHEPDPAHLAAEGPDGQGQDGHLQGQRHLPRHVLPRDARRPQRAADPERRRPGRLRPRLPRGHLRHVRRHDQRPGARPAADDHLPAAHALVQGRRHDRHRAVAGQPRSR